ncbi:MAG TPA: hypothetical protein VLM75_12715 [Spirochaetota bacterium]|nr:hypothetical protein [Spirochaetota bacterium]
MPNITLSLDEALLNKARELARRQSTSLNGLVRALLEERVSGEKELWLEDVFARTDSSRVGSHGRRWKREDLYEK